MCTSLACCFGCCVGKGCSECLGASLKQQIRLSYFIFDAVFVVLALVILYGISGVLSSNNTITDLLRDHVECPADQNKECLGISAVYRISLSLVVLHVFVLFWLLFRNGCSKSFNEGVWFFKVLLVIGSFIGFFFVSNSFFKVYSKVAMALSLVFLLFQIIMLIDLLYIWGTNWIQKYHAGQKGYSYPLIGFSALLYAATIYVIVRSYIWFGGCGVGTLGVTITLVLIILATIFTLAGFNPNGSLLTTSGVAAYSVFFMWSGLSNMEKTCNPLLDKDATTISQLVFGAIIITVALLYVSLGDSKKTSGNVGARGINIAQEVLGNEEAPQSGQRDEEQAQQESKKDSELKMYQGNSFIYFHIIMIFTALYIAMLLTNWGQTVVKGKEFFDLGSSTLSMWIKLGASWATLGLYNWTLIAPKIFPNRDFS